MNWSVALCVVAALYCARAQDVDGSVIGYKMFFFLCMQTRFFFFLQCVSFSSCRPAISTDGGNLRLTSQGDVVFEVGANGSVSFQSPGGAQMSLKGEKVRCIDSPSLATRH